MATAKTTAPAADSPNPNYHQTKYHEDSAYADRFKAYVRGRYQEMPAADQAALIASRVEKYKTDPAVKERQRKSSLAYYYRKKSALQLERAKTVLTF
jgi:hypothetical protein